MQGDVQEVLRSWSWLDPVVTELAGGLINASYAVRVGGEPVAVLQRLNTSVFQPEVHLDIDAVTGHLADRGLSTPRLIRTVDDALWHASEAGVWRALQWVGNRTIHKVRDPADAFSAAELVGRVHGALFDLDWAFRSVRPGPHDTVAHLARMRAAVDTHGDHRLFEEVAPLAEEVEERWSAWQGSLAYPDRVIHGDLKISNVRFADAKAVALVDLDTFQRGSLPVELGDAMRSWCNPATEDHAGAVFDLDVFGAAMAGYAAGAARTDHPPSESEWSGIVAGTERICLELSARFLRDALEEKYFGFEERFGGRGEHNLIRARGQLDLARKVRQARGEAERRLAEARA